MGENGAKCEARRAAGGARAAGRRRRTRRGGRKRGRGAAAMSAMVVGVGGCGERARWRKLERRVDEEISEARLGDGQVAVDADEVHVAQAARHVNGGECRPIFDANLKTIRSLARSPPLLAAPLAAAARRRRSPRRSPPLLVAAARRAAVVRRHSLTYHQNLVECDLQLEGLHKIVNKLERVDQLGVIVAAKVEAAVGCGVSNFAIIERRLY